MYYRLYEYIIFYNGYYFAVKQFMNKLLCFFCTEFIANKIVENLSSNTIQVVQVNVDHFNDSQLVEYVFRAFKETENMTLICYNACTERIMKLVSVLTYSTILYVLISNPFIWFVFIYN